MKTILILRHAKSDWSKPGQTDFDRSLSERGLSDAPRMGEVLALFKSTPDRILASPAKRAKQTAEMVAKACDYKKAIQWEDSFYDGSSINLITALQRLPSSIEQPMLVGHNPIMEETVATLLVNDGENFTLHIPTAGLVCLEVDIVDWATLEPGNAVLRWFLIPKLVKAIYK